MVGQAGMAVVSSGFCMSSSLLRCDDVKLAGLDRCVLYREEILCSALNPGCSSVLYCRVIISGGQVGACFLCLFVCLCV